MRFKPEFAWNYALSNPMRSVYSVLITNLEFMQKAGAHFLGSIRLFCSLGTCTLPNTERFSVKSQNKPYYFHDFNCFTVVSEICPVTWSKKIESWKKKLTIWEKKLSPCLDTRNSWCLGLKEKEAGSGVWVRSRALKLQSNDLFHAENPVLLNWCSMDRQKLIH